MSKGTAVGSVWEMPKKSATIRRPDDTEVTVTDGLHVLDLPGKYVAWAGEDAFEITAK